MILSFLAVTQAGDPLGIATIVIAGLLGIASLATFAYGARWKSAYKVEQATAKSLDEGREAYRARSEQLHGDLKQLMEAHASCIHDLGEAKKRIAELETLPNLGILLEGISQQLAQIADVLKTNNGAMNNEQDEAKGES